MAKIKCKIVLSETTPGRRFLGHAADVEAWPTEEVAQFLTRVLPSILPTRCASHATHIAALAPHCAWFIEPPGDHDSPGDRRQVVLNALVGDSGISAGCTLSHGYRWDPAPLDRLGGRGECISCSGMSLRGNGTRDSWVPGTILASPALPPPPPGGAFDRFLGNWTRKGYEPKYWIISMNGDNCEWRHSDDPTGAPGKVELIGEGQAKVTGIPWGAKWSTLTITGDGTLDEVNGNGEGPWHFVRL